MEQTTKKKTTEGQPKKKGGPTVKELLAKIDSLAKENEELKELIKRKNQEINVAEDEKDEALANRDLVVRAMQRDLTKATEKVAELEAQVAKYSKIGFWTKVALFFGLKHKAE